MTWLVAITEYERGWGNRLDEIKRFKSRKRAENYTKNFNAHNKKDVVPDWYMVASDPYWEDDKEENKS